MEIVAPKMPHKPLLSVSLLKGRKSANHTRLENNLSRLKSIFLHIVLLFIAFVRTHPNLVLLWHKGRYFRAITGDCRLADPTDFIRGITARKMDFFRLDFVSVSDERGSVINNYL